MNARLRRFAAHPGVRFAVTLVLLMAPWPVLDHVYTRGVGALANTALGRDDAEATLRFVPSDKPWRLHAAAESRANGRRIVTELDVRRSGYIALAVFLALVVATPIGGRRRAKVFATGLVPLLLLPLLPLLFFFSGELPVKTVDLGPPARVGVGMAYHALVAAPGMAYALPVLVWLALVSWLASDLVLLRRLRG